MEIIDNVFADTLEVGDIVCDPDTGEDCSIVAVDDDGDYIFVACAGRDEPIAFDSSSIVPLWGFAYDDDDFLEIEE